MGVIILVTVWGEALGGFPRKWDPSLVFNWHPLLMVLSLIIMQGDSILIYRFVLVSGRTEIRQSVSADNELDEAEDPRQGSFLVPGPYDLTRKAG